MRGKASYVVVVPLLAVFAKETIWERCFHHGAGFSVMVWDVPVLALLGILAWLTRRGWAVGPLFLACCFYTAELVIPLPELLRHTYTAANGEHYTDLSYIDVVGGYHAGNVMFTLVTAALMLMAFGLTAAMPRRSRVTEGPGGPDQSLQPASASDTSPAGPGPLSRQP